LWQFLWQFGPEMEQAHSNRDRDIHQAYERSSSFAWTLHESEQLPVREARA
jgi:hypothetical protein